MAEKLLNLSKLVKSLLPWTRSLIDEMNGVLIWGQEILPKMVETSLRMRGKFFLNFFFIFFFTFLQSIS